MKREFKLLVGSLLSALLFFSSGVVIYIASASEVMDRKTQKSKSNDAIVIQENIFSESSERKNLAVAQACYTIDTSRPEWLGLYPPLNLEATGGLDGYVPLSWEEPVSSFPKNTHHDDDEHASLAKHTVDSRSHGIDALLGYNIYRGQTQGGPYPTIVATHIQTTSYDDHTVTNGVRYYYVISADYDAGESAYSNEVSAIPAAGCVGGDRGDANGDGSINILDALAAVNHFLATQPLDEDGQCRADCNADFEVNILDILGIVNVVLGTGTCPPAVVTKSVASPAVVSSQLMFDGNEKALKLSISVDSERDIAGVQLRLSSNTSTLIPGTPSLTERSRYMTIAFNTQNEETIIVIYSKEGGSIQAGSSPILAVPFKTQNAVPNTQNMNLNFEEVILAASCTEIIPVEIEPVVIKTVSLPTVFALEQNYPNPFNPYTDIRYQIADCGSPTHTTLKIFNILGQEVATLVDEMKEAGYYTATWDASDMASGVFFYRLTVSDGEWSQTKRMVLMK